MNFTGRVKNTIPVKFIMLDAASLGIFVQKMYKAELANSGEEFVAPRPKPGE
jgi:hypothetical protein